MARKGLQQGMAGVITGASTGIGRALAVWLAKEFQAKLIVNARTEAALADTVKEVAKHGGSAVVVAGDVGEPGKAEQLVQECLNSFAKIDLLVNNAGMATPGLVTRLKPADWERVFAVNFFAPLHGIYAALPHFLAQRSGSIVNISSVAGKISFPGSVCYAASKFALTGMSQGLAAELTVKGLDVITVCPGWVRTEFFAKNAVKEKRNPTIIASRNDVQGLLMRYLLSISSEACAADIGKALAKGGSHELIMTLPGITLERFNAIFPSATAALLQRLPTNLADPSRSN